jgi:hypothetical protein
VRALLGRRLTLRLVRFLDEDKGVGGMPLLIDDFDFDLNLTEREVRGREDVVRSSFLRLVSDLGRGSPVKGDVEVSLDELAMEGAPSSSSFLFLDRDLDLDLDLTT